MIHLIPFVRGQNDERGTLAYVTWCAIEDAGDWANIFWQLPPDKRNGDLFHWLSYLADPKNPTAMQMWLDDQGVLAGLTWFNCHDDELKTAQGNIWVAKAYRGAPSREIVRLASSYAHSVLGIKKIMGVTANPLSRNLMLRCGYRETARGHHDIYGETKLVYHVEKEEQK